MAGCKWFAIFINLTRGFSDDGAFMVSLINMRISEAIVLSVYGK